MIALFMDYCMSKQLRPKTMKSYEQALQLFARWLREEMEIDDVEDVKEPHIRSYIVDLQKRGKYTFCVNDRSKTANHPQNRRDYRQQVSKKPLDIEGALRLEFYKLEKTFEGDIPLRNEPGGYDPAGAKGAAVPEQKEPLEEVIQKINEAFSGEFGEADRVILYALHERLRTDKKLERKAQSSDPQIFAPQIFAQSIFPGAFESAAMDGYVEQTEAYTSLFQNKSKYNAMMAALAGLIYREFNAAQGGV